MGQAGVAYVIALGANTVNNGFLGNGNSSVGTLTINDTSSFILNSGADLQLGTVATVTPGNITAVTGGTGNIVQNGTSIVSLGGTATAELGAAANGTGKLYHQWRQPEYRHGRRRFCGIYPRRCRKFTWKPSPKITAPLRSEIARWPMERHSP